MKWLGIQDVGVRAVSGRLPEWLAGLVGLGMLAQSMTGILNPALYRDEGFALAAWQVNDPLTLVLAVPVLILSLIASLRGSPAGFLLLLGCMQYALYNYAFYLFGAALNSHFLLYVALTIVSAATLFTGVLRLDVVALSGRLPTRRASRGVAVYMAVWAGVLGLAWIGQALAFAISGEAPPLGAEAFRLIAALDLTLVVAPATLGSVWLWRHELRGVVLSVILNVKGVLYASLLTVASLRGGHVASGGGDGLLALWLFFALGSLVALVFLLRPRAGVPARTA